MPELRYRSAAALAALASLSALLALPSCSEGGSAHRAPPASPARALRIVDTSPLDGESGVTIRRETRIRLSNPVDPATVTSDSIRASAGSTTLDPRLHVSGDGTEVVLFYGRDLPPSTKIEVHIDGDSIRGATGASLDADGDGVEGGVAELGFWTSDLTRVPGTDLRGRVLASTTAPDGSDIPLRGVRISVDGLEGDLDAITDANGNFSLQDVPAGRVFVHINGMPAQAPDGFYYPSVGKTWTSRPGRSTEIGTVHLPAIAYDSLIDLDPAAPTEVRMVPRQLERIADQDLRDALARVRLQMMPGNSFFDDGSPGAMVGLAPVASDRLPGDLPAGLEFPLVVTVQTDGATNFDQPVPIEFPNLPDPVTGDLLPPGAKASLWSFDHDTGRFEVLGSMTVSDDGTTVTSDPGVGLRAPGWHGWGDGNLLVGLFLRNCGGGTCQQRTDCTLVKQLLGIGRDVYNCTGSITGVKRIAGCLFGTASSTASASSATASFAQQWSNDPANPSIVLSWIDSSFGLVGAARSAYKCATSRTLSPAAQLLSCNQAIINSVQSLCTAGGLGAAVPSDCPSNSANVPAWVDRACNNADQAQRLTGLAATGLDGILSPSNLRDVSDKLDLMVTLYGVAKDQAQQAANASRDLTTTEQRTIQTAVTDLRTAFTDTERALAGVSDSLDQLGDALDSYGAMLDDVERQLDRLGPVRRGSFRFRAQTLRGSGARGPAVGAAQVVRGRTTTNGTFEANMNADSAFRIDFFDPVANVLATQIGVTGGQGGTTQAGTALLEDAADFPDRDGDGLADRGELVVGTDPERVDTDGDGVTDRDEVLAGTDPNDGALAGVIGRADTSGPATDVCVAAGLALVATEAHRLDVFNVFSGLAPTRLASIALPGTPRATDVADVAFDGRWAAVAMGAPGVALVNLSDPTAATVSAHVETGPGATCAAILGSHVLVGREDGGLTVIDVWSATIRQELDFRQNRPVLDLAISGEHAYALDNRNLHTLTITGNRLEFVHSQNPRAQFPVRSLFAELDQLFVVHLAGFDRYDLSDPARPRLTDPGSTGRRGFKNLVTDGAGLGVAAVGDDSVLGSGAHEVGIFDLTQPGSVWLGDITTNGEARAVRLDSGLAYVADNANGLVVVRPRDTDHLGIAPVLTADPVFDPAIGVERGAPTLLRARATDDVLVADVRFYVDGVLRVVDTSYPFEFRFTAPTTGTSFTYALRATDTGGRTTALAPATVPLVDDATPPSILWTSPAESSVNDSGSVQRVTVRFDESLDPATVVPASVSLTEAGPDRRLGSADDVALQPAGLSFEETRNALTINAGGPLGDGLYRMRLVDGGLRDRFGNAVAATNIDFAVGAFGLSVRMFAEVDNASRQAFFVGRTPVSFDIYESGRAASTRSATLIPNIDFVATATPWLFGAGRDGTVEQGSRLELPLGDDYSLHALTANQSAFGVLFQGTLIVPQTGDVEFAANIDNDLTLEIDGQVVLDIRGSAGGRHRAQPIPLSAGPHRIRMAFTDYGVASRLQLYADGGGFAGGIVPPAAFGN